MNKKHGILYQNWFYVLLSIVIGFLVGALLLLAAGINPGVAYGKLLDGVFGKTKFMVWSIVYASPLILTGLSVAFAFKTGMFNIGAEGQFVVGSLAACVVGILVKLPAPLHILLCCLAAIAAGALWGLVVGALKVWKGLNEVLSFIMFNWIAFYLSNYVVNLKAIHKEGGGEASKDVADTAKILMPKVVATVTKCTAANWGIVIAILAAILIWFIIGKTTLGFQLRAVGCSRTGAEYAGISSNRIYLMSTAISGALAGLGGAVQILGMSYRIPQFSGQEMYGFQGLTVALIASSNPIGCIFAGLFYGAMKYGGTKLSLVNAPSEIVDIIMGTIIFFIAISHVFRVILTARSGKEA